MMYLSGQIGSALKRPHPDLGVMANPRSLQRGQLAEIVRLGIHWAADNDAFTNFDEPRWLDWLSSMPTRARELCLFAVAPDVVGDAEATLERSRQYLTLIRDLGYPVAYVAQDGFDPERLPWDEIDWIFIGGAAISNWKRREAGGYAAIRAGLAHGKRVHVGRVNGGYFFRQIELAGADSCDGTKLCFGPDANYGIVRSWLNRDMPTSLFGMDL